MCPNRRSTTGIPFLLLNELCSLQGFVYLVSVTGVTGVKESNESRVEGLVALLHGVTDKPVSFLPISS